MKQQPDLDIRTFHALVLTLDKHEHNGWTRVTTTTVGSQRSIILKDPNGDLWAAPHRDREMWNGFMVQVYPRTHTVTEYQVEPS